MCSFASFSTLAGVNSGMEATLREGGGGRNGLAEVGGTNGVATMKIRMIKIRNYMAPKHLFPGPTLAWRTLERQCASLRALLHPRFVRCKVRLPLSSSTRLAAGARTLV